MIALRRPSSREGAKVQNQSYPLIRTRGKRAFAAQRFKDLPDPRQTGKVEVLLLSCPVKALRASLDAARTTEGAVFRPPDAFLFSLSNGRLGAIRSGCASRG